MIEHDRITYLGQDWFIARMRWYSALSNHLSFWELAKYPHGSFHAPRSNLGLLGETGSINRGQLSALMSYTPCATCNIQHDA